MFVDELSLVRCIVRSGSSSEVHGMMMWRHVPSETLS